MNELFITVIYEAVLQAWLETNSVTHQKIRKISKIENDDGLQYFRNDSASLAPQCSHTHSESQAITLFPQCSEVTLETRGNITELSYDSVK